MPLGESAPLTAPTLSWATPPGPPERPAAVQSGIDDTHAYGPPLGPEAERLYETADPGTT